MPCSRHCLSTTDRRLARLVALVAPVILVWIMLWLVLPTKANASQSPPMFQTTFIQLWDKHNSWSQLTWDDLAVTLTSMGVQELVLQWTLITDPAFIWRLTEDRRAEVPHDLVEPAAAVEGIIQAAERARLRVRFGLTHDPNWWSEIANVAALVAPYLQRLWQDQRALADLLVERYGQSPVFAGFYIPQEIDDKTWLDPAKYRLLASHLTRLSTHLTEISPGTTTAISCFFNGFDSPAHAQQFWRELLSETALDAVYIQDGIGAEKLTLNEAALYLRAAVDGAHEAGAEAQIIVELFRQRRKNAFTSPKSRRESEELASEESDVLAFEPASMRRIAMQLRLANELSDAPIIAFSLPE